MQGPRVLDPKTFIFACRHVLLPITPSAGRHRHRHLYSPPIEPRLWTSTKPCSLMMAPRTWVIIEAAKLKSPVSRTSIKRLHNVL